MQWVFFAVPDLQPQAERRRKVTYPKNNRPPVSDAELRQIGGYLAATPDLYEEIIHRLYARLVCTEETTGKLCAVRALVNESTARMEPVSWIDALTDILDGGSYGQA